MMGCTIWALDLLLMAQGGNEAGLTAEDINDRAIHSHIRAMQMLIFTLSHSLRQKSLMRRFRPGHLSHACEHSPTHRQKLTYKGLRSLKGIVYTTHNLAVCKQITFELEKLPFLFLLSHLYACAVTCPHT